MSKTFLLIDDEANSEVSVAVHAEQLSAASEGSLKIETHRPESMQEILGFIAASKPDGLLLDVAFTNSHMEDGAPLPYDGIALAQQIRTLQTRGLHQAGASLPEFPIIRFSQPKVIQEYITGDTTSDDLFDEKIDKPDIITNPKLPARLALSLATDYPKIITYARGESTDEALGDLLGCPAEFLPRIDARALLGLRRRGVPAHVLSRYLTGMLLARSGPLINDALLAIRLGIDRETSIGWSALREGLKRATYTGVFGYGYERWWMPLVLDWWSDQIDSERPPYRLSAEERVRQISEKTNLSGLNPILESPDSPGTRFWHLCLRSQLPVDPAFGFPLMPQWGQEPWQDVDYLCLEEARRNRRDPRLAAAERKRLATLREV